MSEIKALTGSLVLAFIMFAVIFGFIQEQRANASVGYGNEYEARQYTSSNVGTSSLKYFAGTVGSIVVSSTSPVATGGPVIAFYDSASTTIATTSMTAKFSLGSKTGVTPPAGTYTFDVAFGQGIYVWVDPSFNGAYTITYR